MVPALPEDPVMTLLEVITRQVSASFPHTLPSSPSLLPHLQLEADPKMHVGQLHSQIWEQEACMVKELQNCTNVYQQNPRGINMELNYEGTTLEMEEKNFS